MPISSLDNFASLMREWVEWASKLPGVGYSGSTTLWRAQHGAGGSEFGSAIPLGIDLLDARGALRDLVRAMDDLIADRETRSAVHCVQWLYLAGAEQALEQWGRSKTSFYAQVRTGELLIKREMRR